MATAEVREHLDLAQPAVRKLDLRRGQLRAYHFADNPALRGVMLPLHMGQGKSKIAVDYIQNHECRKVLIICPASVLGVWRREFCKWAAFDHELTVLKGGTSNYKASLALASLARKSVPQVIVTNYESAYRDKLGLLLVGTNWDLVVCDEIHRIKKPGGVASKFVGRLRPTARKRIGLTGTPMPHSPLDVYAQYRFLDPTVYGTSFAAFRQKYAITDAMFPSKVLRFIRQDDLSERFYRIAYRPDPDDLVDLPSLTEETRTVALSGEARRLYTQLEDKLCAEWSGGRIDVPNALVKLLRLQQLTSGYVAATGDDGETVTRYLGDWKQKALVDLLSDLPADEPVVVFCRFRPDLDAVMQAAAETGRRYGEVSGRRKDLTPHATMPEGIDLLGVQIQSGGVGIDLTRAAYGVYFSVGFSLGDYEQSIARLHRPGQTRPVMVYHLIAEQTVDRAVYGALKNRREIVEAVLNFIAKGEMDGSDDDWQP